MKKTASSPMILHVSWGRMEVEGHGAFRDAKVFPGGAREWDWKETSTSHIPGIQPADVEELVEKGATRILLGTGMWGRLRVCPETIALLREKGIEVSVMKTPEAIAFYNEMRDYERVAGLFHTTC
jgi:hypothetical protein